MKRHAVTTLLVVLISTPALAAEPTRKSDAAAATTLFYDARALMAKGRYADACPKLEESLRLDEGIGTRFNLADCHEHVGKIATAWAGFMDVAAQAKASGQAAREKVARQRAQTLEPRLPKVVIEVPAQMPGLEVRRDGVIVGNAAWGTPIPVDPGPHVIAVTAPGKQPWETTVQTSEGKTAHATVPRNLPAAAVAAAPPPVVAPPPIVTAPPVPPPAPTAPEPIVTETFPEPVVEQNRGNAQRAVGFVIGALGIASLGVGGGFGLRSLGKRNDAKPHCSGDICDATGVGLRQDAIRAGNVATVTTIAGGVALAGGLLLVLTAPKDKERTGMRVTPSIGMNGGGIVVGGTLP